MQKHWYKVTSSEDEGTLLLTTVRDLVLFVFVCVAIFSCACSINRRRYRRSVHSN